MNSDPEFDIRLIILPPGYCNYRCPFCHEEGVTEARKTRSNPHIDPCEFQDLVLWLQKLGLRGVTVSGGEPLMQFEVVVPILRELPSMPVTVLTNGTWLSKLVPHIYELEQIYWRVNINFPSFNRHIFHQLTGQWRTDPQNIISQLPAALNARAEVNFNCVVCPGKNDNANSLISYIKNASYLGVANVRFLLQPSTSIQEKECLKDILKFPKDPKSRRGGRINSYKNFDQIGIELVQCESNTTPDIGTGTADIYLTTRRTVKLGFWGKERFFNDFENLSAIISRYFRSAH